MESFDAWLDREYRYAARAMLASVSRVDLAKPRPGFGQAIRAARGSVVASPVFGDWTAAPDYFFHWFRDSALVIDALRMLVEAGDMDDIGDREGLEYLRDFVRFSLALQALDGRALVAEPSWRARVKPDFVQYLREDAELSAVHGENVVAETRVNPDGTLDISRWTRPQYDGAPLRALTLLRWLRRVPHDADFNAELTALVRSDLAFTAQHWSRPAFDMWEEEEGFHYHSLCVSAAALEAGAAWLAASGALELAQSCRRHAWEIRHRLDDFWLAEEGIYRSRMSSSGERSRKELDIAVVLAAIHAQGESGAHTPHDPRIHATLARLEALFAAAYPINRQRRDREGRAPRGPAMGRYAGDVYFSGGAYYFSTLGAAELCFRAGIGGKDAAEWIARGDAFLATVRAFTPPGGELSEQFDRSSGAQTSARHLAWSYAAFISCVIARRNCQAR